MTPQQIKLALSGSGFRLPAHIGAIDALESAGVEITEIAGTSGGAIVAALYACGMTVKDMKNMAMNYDWSELLSLNIWSGIRRGAYCSGDALLAFLEKHTNNKRFVDIKIPLNIIASDLRSSSEVCFNVKNNPLMPIATAARASASIPFIYVPVTYANYVLVDGGCCDNLPVSRLSNGGVRVGLYLVSDSKPIRGEMSVIQMAESTIDLMLASNETAHIEESLKEGTVIVHVPTGYAGSLDTHMPQATRALLLKDGHDAMVKCLKMGSLKPR